MRNGVDSKGFAAGICLAGTSLLAVDATAESSVLKAMKAELDRSMEVLGDEPYTGPAILSGEASGVFFHEILGHRVEGIARSSRTRARPSRSYSTSACCPPIFPYTSIPP